MSTSVFPAVSRPRRSIQEGRALIAAWQASGLSAVAFCKSRHISRNRIDFWLRRLRVFDQAKPKAPSSAFIQLVPPGANPSAPAAPKSNIEVTLPNGLRLAIQPGSDLSWSTQVITALLRVGAPC